MKTSLRAGVACLLTAAAAPAGALDVARTLTQNATGACQASLPAYEGRIRKRPLVMLNEGDAAAFVTCSLTGTVSGTHGTRSIHAIRVWFENGGTAPAELSCTMVDGLSSPSYPPTYATKTITLAAGTRLVELSFRPPEGQVGFSFTANTSCLLRPGVGISYTETNFREYVGN